MAPQEESSSGTYTRHLSQVHESKAVVASQDIHNASGLLLVKKGAPIDPATAQKVLQHRLMSPMENQVDLEGQLEPRQLYEDILDLVESHEDLNQLHKGAEHCRLDMRAGSIYALSFPILRQKITVMALQMPEEYRKGLFCAWLSMVLCRDLGLNSQQRNLLFVAALMHDVGMLHIDPAILQKSEELSPAEWRAIQSHTVIGRQIMEAMDNLPAEAGLAILEHHERCDGTGYPRGLFREQLGVMGQMIALTDTLYPLRINHCGNLKRNLQELVPVLQMNEKLFLPKVMNCLLVRIRALDLAPTGSRSHSSLKESAKVLLRDYEVLAQWLISTVELAPHLGDETKHHRLRVIRYAIKELWWLIRTSGLLTAGLHRWIVHVSENDLQSALPELEEFTLMQQELNWQSQHFARQLKLLSEDEQCPTEIRQQVLKALQQLHDTRQSSGDDAPAQSDEAFDAYEYLMEKNVAL